MTAPRGSKLFHNRSLQSQSETSVMQVVCLLIGISGFLFGIFAISRPSSSCKTGTLKSVSVVWEHGDGIISGNDASSVETGIRRHGEVSRHKIMAFVGIFTGFGSVGRRRSLRMTWLPSDPQELERLEESTGLAFRFIIGRSNDKRKMDELQEEIRQYDDFLLLDIEEQYNKLPRKTLAFFKAAHALYDSEFYVKADDDIYLRPDRLSLLLAKDRVHPQTYIGCMKKGPVFTDPNLKWYEPLSYLLGKEYFLHAYGPIYALSAGVVRNLAALRNDSFRMFNNEDVTIGSWMLAMNVHHEANRQLCAPECGPHAIAVWDIPKCSGLCNPETKMVELHKMDICSQSPTLPSDD